MISLAEARSIVARHVSPLGAVSTQLSVAHRRVLRQEIRSPEDVPAFDRSAMDGYAVAIDDSSERFAVVDEVRPGQHPSLTLGKGECVRVFTGAYIPAGASQVLMQEHVQIEGNTIIPQRRGDARHIRHRGEDSRAGDLLLRAGSRLRAPEMALLAQLGITEPTVSPAPRIIHLATGDELVPPGAKPSFGQIRDSNSTLIASLLSEVGARVVHQRHCRDEPAAVPREVKSVPGGGWDVLLISGGASVGAHDFGAEALTKLGFQMHFQKIDLRPGKPLIFGTRGRQVAFVIPGNPVSHFVTFHVVIRAALERLEGAELAWPLAELPLDGELPLAADPRETYWPARMAIVNGRTVVRPLGWRSSGDVCGMASANALLQLLPGSAAIAADGMVKCLLLDLW